MNNSSPMGASSNTPPKSAIEQSTCIDYLKVRVNYSYEENEEKFKNLLEILHVYYYEIHKEKGRNAYANMAQLYQGTTICYGGNHTYAKGHVATSLIEMSGSGCREFENRYLNSHKEKGWLTDESIIREGWIKLFEELMSLEGVCTRIDIPTDDFSGNIKISELKEKIEKKEFTTKMRKTEFTTSHENLEEENVDQTLERQTSTEAKQTGFSVTFGNRDHLQLCIYDKAAEQHNKGAHWDKKSWIRYEVRYYHKRAELAFPLIYKALLEHKEKGFIIGCLAEMIQFKESIDNKSNKCRNKAWDKWEEFIQAAEKNAGFSLVKGVTTIRTNAKWVKKSAALSLGRVATVIDAPYNQIICGYINYFLRKVDKADLQAINQYLRSKGRETFESVEQIKSFHRSRQDMADEIYPDVMELIYMIDSEEKKKDDKDESSNT